MTTLARPRLRPAGRARSRQVKRWSTGLAWTALVWIAVDLMAGGAIDTAPMVGPPAPLDQFAAALDRVRGGDGIKVQVSPARQADEVTGAPGG
jgi:hypothetical protein